MAKIKTRKRRNVRGWILSALAGTVAGTLIYFAPGAPYPLAVGLGLVLLGCLALAGKHRKEGE